MAFFSTIQYNKINLLKTLDNSKSCDIMFSTGEVAERFNALVLKTSEGESPP